MNKHHEYKDMIVVYKDAYIELKRFFLKKIKTTEKLLKLLISNFKNLTVMICSITFKLVFEN